MGDGPARGMVLVWESSSVRSRSSGVYDRASLLRDDVLAASNGIAATCITVTDTRH